MQNLKEDIFCSTFVFFMQILKDVFLKNVGVEVFGGVEKLRARAGFPGANSRTKPNINVRSPTH